MASRGYVKDDWARGGVAVAIIRERGSRRELLTWSTGVVRVLDQEAAAYEEPRAEDMLFVPEDDARALYEALAEHFGHAGHDIRALRKDYESERGRVDKFIAHLTNGPRS